MRRIQCLRKYLVLATMLMESYMTVTRLTRRRASLYCLSYRRTR